MRAQALRSVFAIATALVLLAGCASNEGASPSAPAGAGQTDAGTNAPGGTAATPGESASQPGSPSGSESGATPPANPGSDGQAEPSGNSGNAPSPGSSAGAPAEGAPEASSGAPGTASPSGSPSPSAPAETVEYKGPVEHLFFHPLVAFPELAFDGDRISKGYDDWFVTVPEFKKMLEELYKRDYMLVSISSLYETKTVDGLPSAEAKKLRLPAGKKPLILSVDDINYYDYMRQNGNAWKLVPDSDGSVTAWARTPGGEERTDRDWELVPIVDDFVKAHPDFSWEGAKGVLALTGYEGVFGYRTNELDSPNYEKEKAEALDVIARLRDSGWLFASHSWGHVDANKVSLARLKQDTERWKKEVEPLVGPTDIFIYPYGSRVDDKDPKFAYLRSQGFDVFCSVGPAPYKIYRNGTLQMDRRHIDGVALRTQAKRLEPLFGDADLLDPARDAKAEGLQQ